ncbi:MULTISPECIES: FMN-binding protein [Microbacterium]|uniref:FMN-binding protein n=1 Tax=Microbacterium TaxID=33882 RepID=UPI001EF51159|nr:FMN-binding protein [Microbacterium aurum]MCG7414987.1 FMN-binding protein [Microbacterium aurum]
MIRTTAVPATRRTRASARAGIAAASVLGVITLAGCASAADAEESASTQTDAATPAATASAGEQSGSAGGTIDGAYADGTYTADGSYATPESVETITVTVTLEDDVITDVEVTGNPTKRESEQYQSKFIGGISAEVVGKNIDEISVSRVAGSSLTSGGFNEAIQAIKAEAAA